MYYVTYDPDISNSERLVKVYAFLVEATIIPLSKQRSYIIN